MHRIRLCDYVPGVISFTIQVSVGHRACKVGWNDPAEKDPVGKTHFSLHPLFLNWWCSCRQVELGLTSLCEAVCGCLCVHTSASSPTYRVCPWIMKEKLPGLCAQYTVSQETGLVVRFALTYDLMRSSEACGHSPHLFFLQWVETATFTWMA